MSPEGNSNDGSGWGSRGLTIAIVIDHAIETVNSGIAGRHHARISHIEAHGFTIHHVDHRRLRQLYFNLNILEILFDAGRQTEQRKQPSETSSAMATPVAVNANF